MKTCADLDAWLDHAMPAEERPAFEAHLASCVSCQRTLEHLGRVERAGASWRATLPAQPPLTSSAIVARARDAGSRRVRVVMVGAVAAALVVAVLWWPRTLEGTTTRTETTAVTLRSGEDVFTVEPSSELVFVSVSSKRTRARLERGAVRVVAAKRQANESLEVESGPVVVTVIGTRFDVRRGATATTVEVEEGVVRVQGPGRDERLSAGSTLVVSHEPEPEPEPPAADAGEALPVVDAGVVPSVGPGDEVKRPRRASPEKLSEWTRRLVSGEVDAVERELARHVSLVRDDVPALLLLGDCRRKAAKWAAAATTYELAAKVASPADARRALVLAASVRQDELGDQRRAAKLLGTYLESAPASDPVHASAMLRLGRALEATGHRAEAIATYQRLIATHAASPEATDSRRRLATLGTTP